VESEASGSVSFMISFRVVYAGDVRSTLVRMWWSVTVHTARHGAPDTLRPRRNIAIGIADLEMCGGERATDSEPLNRRA
jgi:hypothetical protein